MTPARILTASLVVAAIGIGFIAQSGGTSEPASAPTSWKSFDEAVAIAHKENRKILIDVYTDWCGWCKRMDEEVYANAAVAQVLDGRFVSVKLNAESSERTLTFRGRKFTEQEFASGAGVTGYPTTIFLDSSAEPITVLPGYVPADRFVPILRYIGEDHYKTLSFDEYRKQATRSPQ